MTTVDIVNDHAQIVEAFVTETDELITNLEELLLRLEESPDDDELLNAIFRGAHTIKGNASCLQYEELTAFANVFEESLERLRNGEEHATPARVSRLLDALDALRDLSVRSVAGQAALTSAQEALMQQLLHETTGAAGEAVSGALATNVDGLKARHFGSDRTLRIATEKLDKMLDLTGEIAVARGHVRQLAAQDERVLDAVRELDRLSFDLQELVMNARLVPLGPALRPFQRIVRDVAASRQKLVTLIVEAGEVEVDTTVIEQLKDPITHMLRNAIDHGIEDADARIAAGKTPAGMIRISASYENGGVAIRLSDDGQGLDETAIAARARALSIDPERLSRHELLRLVFEPGFTTADEVTDISGRGVGMDVVRRNVEALRGTIAIASQPGAGTAITMRLPLTVTVLEGFAMTVGDETYVIPIDAVVECTALPPDAADDAVGVLNVRGEALPFLRLRNLFGLGLTPPSRENVVVIQHEQGRAGIVVDTLLGSSETVMKPLGGLLRQLPGVAGSSILGNGRVALVLDASEVVRRAAESQTTN
jgi:two-component system, chemotaxis family, sensor kinase CheA